MADQPPIPYAPELLRLFARSARVNRDVDPQWPVSFPGLLAAFLLADDPLSAWFRDFLRGTQAEARLLMERKLDPSALDSLRAEPLPAPIAGRPTPVPGPAPAAAGEEFFFSEVKQAWRVTQSARDILAAADGFRRQLPGAPSRPLGPQHVMGAYIYESETHARDLDSWGFDREQWSNAFLGQVALLHPDESGMWMDAHRRAYGREPEIPAPASDAGGPSAHLASDRWTRDDALGYTRYAYAIYRFMTHPRTSAPLTIGIQAPWGGGKTSLMRMLQKFLDPNAPEEIQLGLETPQIKMKEALAELSYGEIETPPEPGKPKRTPPGSRQSLVDPGAAPRRDGRPFTVWFNAWQYATSDQVWAGLADAILRQVAAQLAPEQRARFWLRLNRGRVDPYRFAQAWQADVLREWLARKRGLTSPPWLLITAGVVASAAVSVADWGQAVLKEEIVGRAGITLSLLAAAAQLLNEYRQARDKARSDYENKLASLQLGEYLDAPDYRATAGFVHHAARDLRRVLDSLDEVVGREARINLVVFVDDLDRCTPENVAHVVEGINGFLAGDFPKCMFVIGMDAEMVAAALEAAQADVIQRLPKDATTPIGWRFMDKFIQLPFVIPPADRDDVDRYTAALFAAELRPAGKAAMKAGVGPQAQRAETPEAVPAETWEEQRERIDRGVGTFSDANAEVHRAIRQAAAQFSHNPREVKRFINAFRFQYFLWWARPEGDRPGLDQLQRWVVLSMKWPDLVRWLRRGGGRERRPETAAAPPARKSRSKAAAAPPARESRLKRLEAAAARAADDMAAWQAEAEQEFRVKKEDLPWLNDDDLRRFFREEAARPDGQRLSDGEGQGLW